MTTLSEAEKMFAQYQELAVGDDKAAQAFLKTEFPKLSKDAQTALMTHALTVAMEDVARSRDTETVVRAEVLDEVLRALAEREEKGE